MERKIECAKLYQEYLEAKRRLKAQINGPATKGTYSPIDYKDALKPKQLARELIQYCEPFLREMPGEFYVVERDADEQCVCGHLHSMHNGLKRFEDREPIPKYERGSKCRVTDCKCEHFLLRN